jgi:choline-glycine betaine transporter
MTFQSSEGLNADLGLYTVLTTILEEPTVSTFTRQQEGIGSSKTLVNTSNITWHINPENQYPNNFTCFVWAWSLFSYEHILRAFENNMLKRMFGPK